MMLIGQMLSLFGHALLIAALLTRPLRRKSLPVAWRGGATAVALALAFAPLDGVPVVGYMHAVFGDLSVTSLVLLGAALVSFMVGRAVFPARERHIVFAGVAAMALFLYPFALGFTYFDSYALGYGSYFLATTLFVLAMWAWHAGIGLAVLCAVGAALAYVLGLFESDNLWDYLIDPIVALYALAVSLRWIRRAYVARQKQ